MQNEVLVHCCCAVCAGYPLELLKQDDYIPIAYFYNPNLYPFCEFEKRADAIKTLCEFNQTELIIADYDNDFYENEMREFREYKEGSVRCNMCFEIRLRKTCEKAVEQGVKYFTTTLSVSPHKNFDVIKQIGNSFAKEYDLIFLDYNFKKKDGFLKTMKLAKELNIYRQNYCGCRNSLPQI